MLREDLVSEDGDELAVEDVVYVELSCRVLVAREDLAARRPMTADEYARWLMAYAYEVRAGRIGPHVEPAVCERGHVVPADRLELVPEYRGQDVLIPEHEECEDCTDEAVAEAERRAER